MKRYLLTAALSIFVVACNQPTQSPQAAPDQTGSAADAPQPELVVQPQTAVVGSKGMPAGVALTFPYHTRADLSTMDQAGRHHRHVVLEYLDGDGDSTLASIEQSMVAAGYRSLPKRDQPDGRVAIPYAKNGADNVVVVLDNSPVVKPRNPAAKGTVTVQFIDERPAPISTDAN